MGAEEETDTETWLFDDADDQPASPPARPRRPQGGRRRKRRRRRGSRPVSPLLTTLLVVLILLLLCGIMFVIAYKQKLIGQRATPEPWHRAVADTMVDLPDPGRLATAKRWNSVAPTWDRCGAGHNPSVPDTGADLA